MKPYLTGKDLIRLMRKHRVTIRELSDRMGITMKRIRQVRLFGLFCPHTARDWIQAVTGQDPGWLGEIYQEGKQDDCRRKVRRSQSLRQTRTRAD